MLYKLTKGALSVIRKNKAEIDAEIENGFILDGEVNDEYKVINAHPHFGFDDVPTVDSVSEKAKRRWK